VPVQQIELKTERVAIAYRLLLAYAFIRPESEQNSSHLQINCDQTAWFLTRLWLSAEEGEAIMFEWIQSLVGLTPAAQLAEIEKREPTFVEEIQKREPTLEERLARLTGRMRGYNQKMAEELDEIVSDLNTVLGIVEDIIAALENIGGAERARNLRTRLKSARTRARNAASRVQEQLRAAG
jgi:hypothetical protein